MPKRSAGLLMVRMRDGVAEVFLVHPGGPFWAKKDAGAWSIPKGEIEPGEPALAAAQREFREETGFLSAEPFLELGEARQPSGKIVTAWAFPGECNPAHLVSISCQIEWPPRSKRMLTIPEIDRGAWFSLHAAQEKILVGQRVFLARLAAALPTLSATFSQFEAKLVPEREPTEKKL